MPAGYEDDLLTASQVSGLDVIVGGHSHTFLYTPTTAGPVVARGPGVNASTCVAKVRHKHGKHRKLPQLNYSFANLELKMLQG